jgi:hypothetical protein
MKTPRPYLASWKMICVALAVAMSAPVHAEQGGNLPVRIYVLVGQSNMQGKVKFDEIHVGSAYESVVGGVTLFRGQ